MTCPTDEVLAAWSAGALTDVERDDVEDHAAGCVACRGLAAAIAGVAASGDRGFGAEGAMIGRYRVIGSAGSGAMGVVLRGHDPVLDRDVAIKMLHDATAANRARMLREAQTLARIDHPNVVHVHDAGELGDEVFVAMAFVTGPTLARWLTGTPRTIAERVAVLRSAGAGIAAIHAAGLVHRDIKPDNIVVHGDTGVVVDLGLARPPGGGAAGSGIAGTPRYLAPEVRRGDPATAASDQWAWWTVVAETLDEPSNATSADTESRPKPSLARAIARGLADDPARRYPSMTAAVAALDRALAPGRSRWPWLVGGAVAGAAAILLAALARPAAEADACAMRLPARWIDGRAAIADRLAGAGADVGRVVAAIDIRAYDAARLRAGACVAAREATGEDRTRALRRLVCIDDSWTGTEHILQGLVDPAPHVVRAAVDELIDVPPVARCEGGTIPSVPGPPPPAVADRASAVEAALRAIRFDPDREPHARLARLRALEPELSAVGYAPFVAAWHVDIAGELAATGDTAGAHLELEAALAVDEAAGDDDGRARVLIDLLRAAYSAGTPETPALERTAEAAVARLGNPAVTAELRMSQGMARVARGDRAGARAAMREAAQIFDAIAIDAHGQLVMVAMNLGGIEQTAGDLAAAQRAFDRGLAIAVRRYGDADPHTLEIRGARATNLLYAKQLPEARRELAAVAADLERALGASEPVTEALHYVCEADLELADRDSARASCEAALAAAERVFGATHPRLAWPLALVGRDRVEAGRPADALAPLERALAITEHGAVSPVDRPVAEAYLAIALHELHRDPARAQQLAADARRALASEPTAADVLVRLGDGFK